MDASSRINPYAGADVANSADIEAKVQKAAMKMAGDWSELPEGHVLLKMSAALPEILKETGYAEMYGVELVAPAEGEKAAPFSTLIVLQKFLRANDNDVSKAKEQLTAALQWRKEFQPLKVKDEVFNKDKFEGLGYVTELKGVPGSPNEEDVVTFNIYGSVKNTKKTFGDTDEFIRWRVALMELTLQHLHLNEAKQPIPDFGKGADPYQAIQVHDYLSVSFFRQPSEVKAASSKTIQLFQKVYPETMAKKYFVNVPLVMQWMFAAMQMFMAKETIAKMQWMSYGGELHKYIGASAPTAYGGSGPELASVGDAPKYIGDDAGTTATAVAAEGADSTGATATTTAAAPAEPTEPEAKAEEKNAESVGTVAPAEPTEPEAKTEEKEEEEEEEKKNNVETKDVAPAEAGATAEASKTEAAASAPTETTPIINPA